MVDYEKLKSFKDLMKKLRDWGIKRNEYRITRAFEKLKRRNDANSTNDRI